MSSFRSKMSEKNLSLIASSTAQYSPVNDFSDEEKKAPEVVPEIQQIEKVKDITIKTESIPEEKQEILSKKDKNPKKTVSKKESTRTQANIYDENDSEIKIVINTTEEIHDKVKRFAQLKKTTTGKVVSRVFEEYLTGNLDIDLTEHDVDDDGFIIQSEENLSKPMGMEITESLYNAIKENFKELSIKTRRKFFINDNTTRLLKRYFELKKFE